MYKSIHVQYMHQPHALGETGGVAPSVVQVMNHALHSVPDTENEGRAQFSPPLQEALWLLGNSTECHRVLIVFTDGERETHLPIDLVRENNKDIEVCVCVCVCVCADYFIPSYILGSSIHIPGGIWT